MHWPFSGRRGGDPSPSSPTSGAHTPPGDDDATTTSITPTPPASALTAALDASEPADAAAWSDAETHVRVDRVHGFLCRVSVHARVDLPPAGVFAILTQPDNSGVFRAIETMPYRRVLKEEEGHGSDSARRRTVEVEHVARWRAGPLLTGTLSTRLVVEEDPGTGTVAFRLAPGGPRGFMAAFEGAWRVSPFTQGALDAVLSGGEGGGAAPPPPSPSSSGGPWAFAGAALARALPTTAHADRHHHHHLSSAGASLVTLTQAVGPRVPLPPPLDRLVAAICARQVRGLLQDLRAEAARRRHREAGQWRDGGGGGGGGRSGESGEPPALVVVPGPGRAGGAPRQRLLW
jgi:hypothetical protein